jgi:hypothetical protein
MTPSEFARAELTRIMEAAKVENVDGPAALRSLLDAAAAALADVSGVEDAQNELTFIAQNMGDDEDHVFMRP